MTTSPRSPVADKTAPTETLPAVEPGSPQLPQVAAPVGPEMTEKPNISTTPAPPMPTKQTPVSTVLIENGKSKIKTSHGNGSAPKSPTAKAKPSLDVSPNASATSSPTNGVKNGNSPASPSKARELTADRKIEKEATTTDENENVNPQDFYGEVETNNDIPSQETLRKLESHIVLDAAGKTHTFKSLYTGRNAARRVLVIFVRHFFCGMCQEYLRTVSQSITPEALLSLPVPTAIVVIGCGDPRLIPTYVRETGSPFNIYADPTRRLYTELGMVRTLAAGSKPAYMQTKTFAGTIVSGITQGLKQVRSGLVFKMGDQKQVGGEFLFEPENLDIQTPISTPKTEIDKQIHDNFATKPEEDILAVSPTALDHKDADSKDAKGELHGAEEKIVTWCHRMRTTRDHAEVPELMDVLGLDGEGKPIQDIKRWEKARRTRKGTGLSMAGRMGRMSMDAKAAIGDLKEVENGNDV